MSILNFFRKKKSLPMPWKKYYTEDELNVKIPNISMYEQIRRSSIKFPNYKAIEYLKKDITYKELIKEIDKCSLAFSKLGINKGDIVTICLPNIPEALISIYALNKLGAVASMIHPLSAEEEIKKSLLYTKSKYLIFLDKFYSNIENVIKQTDVSKVIFVNPSNSLNFIMRFCYNIKQIGKYKKHPKDDLFLDYSKFIKLSKKAKNVKFTKYGRNTPAIILNSGGTSGTPKHVVLQNRAFILGTMQEKIALKKLNVGDSCMGIMPNFHGFGLSVTMHTPLCLGCYTILVPEFNAKKFDTLFKRTRPTILLGVPTLYEALINSHNEKDLDLSFIKYAISGGDILTKNLEDRVNNYFKEHNCNAVITQGYGLSEALAAVTLASDVNKSGSIGIPLAGNYVKIIDPATRESLPYGEIGEICVHTKAMMMGYLNNESETNDALQVHDDGHVWLHTGDLGYMDSDGFVFYKGRKKRMIITSGYNVYPSHIEEVIESHPAVLQCTVIGIPHSYKQEVCKAFIVLKPGFHGLFIKSEIKNFCKKNLAKYMVPYEFVYRKNLPKTKLGKVDFNKLKSDIGVDDDE